MPLQPRHLTPAELVTEAETRYPADPFITALARMAADNSDDYRQTCDDVAEDFGFHSPESLREFLESAHDERDEDETE